MDSRRYAPPKKSNTPLIIGLAGGGLLLVIVVIAMASGGGGSQGRPRSGGNFRKKTPSTSGGAQYGGQQPRELTAEEKQKLAEASRLENEAQATLNKYFDKRGGSYSLMPDYQGQKPMVLTEIRGAIASMERRMAIMEELQNQTGESYDEGNHGPRLMKSLKMVRRALE